MQSLGVIVVAVLLIASSTAASESACCALYASFHLLNTYSIGLSAGDHAGNNCCVWPAPKMTSSMSPR